MALVSQFAIACIQAVPDKPGGNGEAVDKAGWPDRVEWLSVAHGIMASRLIALIVEYYGGDIKKKF